MTVAARVDSQKIGEQDQLQLTIEVSGPAAGSVRTIGLPVMKNLKVVGGPSLSTRFQWVNGVSSSSKSFTYILLPTAKGSAEIPSVMLEHEGKTYRTQPIAIDVVEGSLRQRATPQQFPFPDVLDREQRRKEEPDIIARAVVDKNKLYQGEQLTLSYKLYTTVTILDINISEMPSYEGFWVEDLKVDPEASARIVEMNGKRYYEYTIMKKALFPSTPGAKTIKPLTIAIAAKARGGDIFDSVFFDNPVRIFRKTESVQLDVIALPQKSVPESFSGAIGDFTMSVGADRKECAVNDAVGVKITVQGKGNLKGAAPPAIPVLPDFKIYEPKVSEETRFEGDTLQSKKVWDYIFIPLTPGKHVIPEISFSSFDPGRNDYETERSGSIPLSVSKGQSETPGPAAIQKGDVTPLRSDINFIKPLRGEIRDAGKEIYRHGWFYMMLIIPFFCTPAYIYFSLRCEKVRMDVGGVRLKKASRNARNLLKKAQKLLKKGDELAALQEISKAMAGFVADKFNQSASGLTYEKIEEMLETKDVQDDVIRRFLTVLEKCDYLRFSKGSVTAEEAADLLTQAEGSVSELDRML